MGPLYQALGLTVGVIQHEASFLYDPKLRDVRTFASPRSARARAGRRIGPTSPTAPTTSSASTTCATTCGSRLDELVQRDLHYAIVDEVDSILIDEARTPLIISGPAEESTDLYYRIDRIIPQLKRAATIVEGKLSEIEAEKDGRLHRRREGAVRSSLTEEGIASCERLLNVDNLYDPAATSTMLHHVQQALRAHALYKRDVDYVVKDGEVIIVDEFTGPPDAGPALVRRPAPGGRGQGRRPDRAREPDARHHHLPELLPDVRQARRHDRHRRDRGRGVREDLQARRHGDPDQSRPAPRQRARTSSTRREREKFNAVVDDIIERHETGPARPRRHRLDREVRDALPSS